MAGTIKGIIIEFRGDTTSVDKAIRKINSETRDLNKELKSIDKALKFNPTSVELWRQKQEVLTQKIDQTSEKLKVLKQTQQQMDASGVDKTSAEYRNLQRQIIETESQLKTFKGELKSIGNVNLRAASESVKELGNNLTKAGQAMKGLSIAGAAVVASLGAMAYKSGAWADDLNTMSKVYGIGTQELQKYAASAALVDVEVETIAGAHRKLTRSMSSAQEGTGSAAEAYAQLGVAITDANGNLRSSDDVFNDVIVALGQMENETERDALAMELMGKSAAELNPLIEDGGETYKRTAEIFSKYGLSYIDQGTLDRANQFNDSLDTIKALGAVAFQQIGTQLAGYLAPALEKVVDLVGKIAGWLANLDPRVLAIIGAIAGVVAIVAPLLTGLGQLAFAISSIMGLMATIGPAIGAVLAAAGPIVLVIGAIVAAGIILYKHWDEIKAGAIQLWNSIKTTFTNLKNSIVQIWNNIKTAVMNVWNSLKTTATNVFNGIRNTISNIFNNIRNTAVNVWNSIKTAIMNPISTAVEFVRNAIDRLRSILSGRLSFPHIRLPHFSIRGRFSLNPPSVPHLGVDWYKTGGIFNSPSIIGVGEAGSEAVVPLDTLWSKMDAIANAAGSNGGGAPITINVYGSAGMNVNDLALAVEKRLVQLQNQRNKAMGV